MAVGFRRVGPVMLHDHVQMSFFLLWAFCQGGDRLQRMVYHFSLCRED